MPINHCQTAWKSGYKSTSELNNDEWTNSKEETIASIDARRTKLCNGVSEIFITLYGAYKYD